MHSNCRESVRFTPNPFQDRNVGGMGSVVRNYKTYSKFRANEVQGKWWKYCSAGILLRLVYLIMHGNRCIYFQHYYVGYPSTDFCWVSYVNPTYAYCTKKTGVGEFVYDINLNYLGVRSQESGVRSKERRRIKSSRRRKFFVPTLIGIWYHTFIHQRQKT